MQPVFVSLTEDKRGGRKSPEASGKGGSCKLTASGSTSREETLHLVIDLRYLLTAIE